MENSQWRRNQQSTAASPRLLRSKSGSTPLLETRTFIPKFRTSKLEGNPKSLACKTPKKPEENAIVKSVGDAGFVRFLPRSKSKVDVNRRPKSASTSPSAWALSPGRSLRCSSPGQREVVPPSKSPARFDKLMKIETSTTGRGVSGGRVSGVLKYFRQKKISPALEEEYHRFRMIYNILLQWRFANARAETSMATVKRVAQKKLFSRWVSISQIRNSIVENRIKIQRLKHEIKLYDILYSEMNLLNEWSKLETKNVEAVSRVVRKLSAISLCLPLVQNAQGDVRYVSDAISLAIGVMDNIQAMILHMHWQVEKTCHLLMALSATLNQQKQFFQELEKSITMVASLKVQEKSLRVHYLQMVKESTYSNMNF